MLDPLLSGLQILTSGILKPPCAVGAIIIFILFYRFYLFIFREGKTGRKRDRNISVWLSLTHPSLGTWPATQACALDRASNQQPFASQASTQPTKPHQPGHYFHIFFVRKIVHSRVKRLSQATLSVHGSASLGWAQVRIPSLWHKVVSKHAWEFPLT